MSIRTKILISLLLAVFVGIFIAGFASYRSGADNAEIAVLTGKSIDVGELTRRAHDDFDRLSDLVAEVTAMTHFIEPSEIEKRFKDSAASMDSDLSGLQTAALSPEMSKLAGDAAQRFAAWRDQAEGVLGLKPAQEIATQDLLKRDADSLKALLNQALALAGGDARARIAEVAASAKAGTSLLLFAAIGLGIAGSIGAFVLAKSLARPLLDLSLNAEKLSGGDVSVAFSASGRKDEIGEISRAVARFRDNVLASQAAEAAAAADRQAAEDARQQNERLRSASSEEQAKVVDALGAALNRLANGDLTFRLAGEFLASYARLKTDFNASQETLQQAMSMIVGNAEDMQEGSREISGLAGDLAQRTSAQTASIEEAAAALEEITATVKMTADGAGQARQIVSQARTEVEKSGEIVRTAVDAIGRIQKSSQEINTIVDVIDEIAFQTNSLALNAAVEAARAGESGRGFAVVATEVRALASRSAQASKEIRTLISASRAHVEEGVSLVTSAGSTLDRIFTRVVEIDGVITNIANGAREQAAGLQSVNNGVADIDRVTQTNVAMVEQASAASAGLAKRAEELARSVARFKIGAGAERRLSREVQPEKPTPLRRRA